MSNQDANLTGILSPNVHLTVANEPTRQMLVSRCLLKKGETTLGADGCPSATNMREYRGCRNPVSSGKRVARFAALVRTNNLG